MVDGQRSGFDKLTYNLETLSEAGIGGVEITPIYGELKEGKSIISTIFQQNGWIYSASPSPKHHDWVGVDMNNGTGCPSGTR